MATIYFVTTMVRRNGRASTTIGSMASTLEDATARAIRQQRETVNEFSPHGWEYRPVNAYRAERADGTGDIVTGVRS